MAAVLSSNWAQLQKAQQKRKRSDASSVSKSAHTTKKSKKDRSARQHRQAQLSGQPSDEGIAQAVLKNDKRKQEGLLEWADDNDITVEDLEKAYGKDAVLASAKSESSTSTRSAEIFAKLAAEERAAMKRLRRPVTIDESKTEIGKYVSLDCEFVGIGPDGKRSALARVSIVNYHGATVLDEFVRPEEKVTDWRTWVSGVRPSDMKNALTFKEVQTRVAEIIDGRVLVGHALRNDMKVLQVSHPRKMMRDTARHPAFRKLVKGGSPSLKKLASAVLNLDIQGAEHSSVEDARACILLFRSDKDAFEQDSARRSGVGRAADPVVDS
ncbi:ribonuclease H-like domain-containing protein [Limtongia smithiae]|uniref:ribonuclease H-like domain-containing protein n=1 Tax=Limtongia smithiae TaxID=1125753 RepID=UPI0034CE5DF9